MMEKNSIYTTTNPDLISALKKEMCYQDSPTNPICQKCVHAIHGNNMELACGLNKGCVFFVPYAATCNYFEPKETEK